jgi:hypothetical protein
MPKGPFFILNPKTTSFLWAAQQSLKKLISGNSMSPSVLNFERNRSQRRIEAGYFQIPARNLIT